MTIDGVLTIEITSISFVGIYIRDVLFVSTMRKIKYVLHELRTCLQKNYMHNYYKFYTSLMDTDYTEIFGSIAQLKQMRPVLKKRLLLANLRGISGSLKVGSKSLYISKGQG